MAKPESVFITIRGKLNYAKILGAPVDNYERNGKEWKMDLIPLDEAKARDQLKRAGISDALKQKEEYLDGTPYIPLKQRAEKKDGSKNESPRVEDITGEPWPQDKLLGNGTIADVKIRVADYGKGLKKGKYINGVRVLEHVSYAKPVFEELDKDDPYYQKANAAAKAKQEQMDDEGEEQEDTNEDRSDLDDDVPF